MKRTFAIALAAAAAAVALAGCASPTGIVPIGKGLYMASNMDYMAWSAGQVKAQLYKDASAFCAKTGKEVVPQGGKSNDASMYGSYASAEIQFTCE